MLTTIVLMTHLLATIAMTGVVWTMQLVHYPSFALIEPAHFAEFAWRHSRTTSTLVVPLMLLEAITAAILLVRPSVNFPAPAPLLGAVLLLIAWFSTFALQVPCHRHLAGGFDAAAHRRLVRTNWLRTIAWTARSGLVIWGLTR